MSIFDLFKEQQFFKTNPVSARKAQDNLPMLFDQCAKCKAPIEKEQLQKCYGICPTCDFHHPINFKQRAELLYDNNAYELLDCDLQSKDFLNFADRKSYADRIKAYLASGNPYDAFISTQGRLNSQEVLIGFFNFSVLGGSMGSVVGEKVCRLFERGMEQTLPVIIFHTTGGARMQEGLTSLFQMGKTSMVLNRFRQKAVRPYLSVLCYPSTGGVAASFGLAGDINLAERDALIGFAGPRVIQQAIRKPLPEGFQTADYVFENGMVDAVVHRKNLKEHLAKIIHLLRKD